MTLKERYTKALRKKADRGFRGHPVATVAYYGPDDVIATKVTISIILGEDEEPAVLERWFSQGTDLRKDHEVSKRILEFIDAHGARSVAMMNRIIGCPHEEGVDYPEGTTCPRCPFWANRNRWTGEVEH